MYEEQDQLDEDLARLAESLRSGEHMLACLRLAEFALKLERCIRCEERAFAMASHAPLAKVHREHDSMRRLIGLIASALDRTDDRRCLEVIGKLRSVLLLHLEKERALHTVH